MLYWRRLDRDIAYRQTLETTQTGSPRPAAFPVRPNVPRQYDRPPCRNRCRSGLARQNTSRRSMPEGNTTSSTVPWHSSGPSGTSTGCGEREHNPIRMPFRQHHRASRIAQLTLGKAVMRGVVYAVINHQPAMAAHEWRCTATDFEDLPTPLRGRLEGDGRRTRRADPPRRSRLGGNTRSKYTHDKYPWCWMGLGGPFLPDAFPGTAGGARSRWRAWPNGSGMCVENTLASLLSTPSKAMP